MGSFVFQYKNVDKDFTASGFELNADYKFTNSLRLRANATYTKVEEDLSLRIPELKINVKLNYQVCDATFMSLSYQFNDKREDAFYNSTTFATEAVRLESYSLLDFYISHKLVNNKVTLFANITNLLNTDYQELHGYTTKGRNVNIGFNLSL